MQIGSKQTMLLLIYSSPSEQGRLRSIIGRTRLMKIVFLFQKELITHLQKHQFDLDDLPIFSAYKYGPFSQEVYADLEFLKSVELLLETPILSAQETSEEERLEYLTWKQEVADPSGFGLDEDQLKLIELTPTGCEYTEEVILPLVSVPHQKVIRSFVLRLAKLPLATLLKYVYQTYPDYTENSEILNRVMDQ